MSSAASRLLLAAAAMIALPFAAPSQEQALRRTFQQGSVENYRVEVTLRAELHGVKTETIGAKTYVHPFTREAEGNLRWTASRRVERLDATAGAAEITESLEGVAGDCPSAIEKEAEAVALSPTIQPFCDEWKPPRVLRYRETNDGLLRALDEASLGVTKAGCPLLDLWSRHALRPNAILPAGALRIGAREEKKTPVHLPGMSPGESSEVIEWLAAPHGAAVRLHVTQQVALDRPAQDRSGSGGFRRLEWDRFFAESLSTLSTLDGGLIDATRSASCETSYTDAPVEGLNEPPKFSFKLSLTVTIHRAP
ncbi:MAG TPA: hypothetical protein VEH49_00785 [Methylomirabilota bacterium]|nr:hypothetical protein [Methylomirabilota bacterium]